MFTYDLATSTGLVRLELGDDQYQAGVKPDGTNLTDEEIGVYLEREGAVMRAVAGLCEMLSVRYSGLSDVSVGPRRESLGQIANAYANRARDLRAKYGGNSAQVNGSFSYQPTRADGYSSAASGDEYGR